MYELNHDGSGKAYDSIVSLRREKILNFLTVPDMKGVKEFYPYKYEDLSLDGTASLIETLEKATGKKAKCEAYQGTGVTKHKRVDRKYLDWMDENVDWEAEAKIGYAMRSNNKPRRNRISPNIQANKISEDEEEESTSANYVELEESSVASTTEPVTYTHGPVINNHKGPATSINLIGERHSGTNWITDHLADCVSSYLAIDEIEFTPIFHSEVILCFPLL